MSEDIEMLPPPERSRVDARDRKVRGPKVIADNSGLRKVTMQVAERLRAGARRPAAEGPARGPSKSPTSRSRRER